MFDRPLFSEKPCSVCTKKTKLVCIKCKIYRDWIKKTYSEINEKYNISYLYNEKQMSTPELSRFLSENVGYKINSVKILNFLGIPLRHLNDPIMNENKVEKTIRSNLIKYGAVNVLSKGTPSYYKRNETVKSVYGVDNVFQLPEIKAKIPKTDKKNVKYWEAWHKKYKAKTGYENPFQNPDIIEKIWNTKRENGTLITGNKQHTRLSNIHKMALDGLSKYGYDIKNEQFLTEITHINGSKYKPVVDMYIEKLNLIIEVYGTYWHCDPRVYKDTDLIKTFSGIKLVDEIHQKDIDRMEKLKKAGYNFLILWQKDIEDNKTGEIFENWLKNH